MIMMEYVKAVKSIKVKHGIVRLISKTRELYANSVKDLKSTLLEAMRVVLSLASSVFVGLCAQKIQH